MIYFCCNITLCAIYFKPKQSFKMMNIKKTKLERIRKYELKFFNIKYY